MAKQISIEHAFKVFGDAPEAALALVREGHSKNEILARTGQSIGVFDAHFDIGAGEIFVVMGLSGSGHPPMGARAALTPATSRGPTLPSPGS